MLQYHHTLAPPTFVMMVSFDDALNHARVQHEDRRDRERRFYVVLRSRARSARSGDLRDPVRGVLGR